MWRIPRPWPGMRSKLIATTFTPRDLEGDLLSSACFSVEFICQVWKPVKSCSESLCSLSKRASPPRHFAAELSAALALAYNSVHTIQHMALFWLAVSSSNAVLCTNPPLAHAGIERKIPPSVRHRSMPTDLAVVMQIHRFWRHCRQSMQGSPMPTSKNVWLCRLMLTLIWCGQNLKATIGAAPRSDSR